MPSCLCIDLQNHASTRAKNHATRKSTAETNTHENTKNTNRKHTRHKMYCRFHAYSQNSAHPWHSDAESPKLSCLTISAHAFRPSMKIAILDFEELIVSGGECDKPRRAVVFRGLVFYDSSTGPHPCWFARLVSWVCATIAERECGIGSRLGSRDWRSLWSFGAHKCVSCDAFVGFDGGVIGSAEAHYRAQKW